MNQQNAIIIGGGIAGPAMALALQQVGIASTIYEASASPRDKAGAFLNLAPNGLNVLRALALDDLTTELGFRNDRLIFHNDSGRILAEAAVGGVTMMRGALSRALREAAVATGVPFAFGKTLTAVVENDQGVTATFADGTTTTGQMLIGCDGIHSRTRHSYFPAAPKPAYTGIINLGGVVQTDLTTTDTAMHMIFGRRGFFGYAVRPSGETYWFSNFAQREEPTRSLLEGLAGSEFRQKLLEVHQDDPTEVTRILQAISGNLGAYPVYDILSLPRWQRGSAWIGRVGEPFHQTGGSRDRA